MNTSDLKKLSEALKEGGFHFLEVKTPETNVRMVLDAAPPQEDVEMESSPGEPGLPGKPEDKTIKVNSERVGVFSFGKIPLTVGAGVKKGEIMGSIKGISMQDHVIAPVSGKIADILVKQGQIVEFGKPLFRITPTE